MSRQDHSEKAAHKICSSEGREGEALGPCRTVGGPQWTVSLIRYPALCTTGSSSLRMLPSPLHTKLQMPATVLPRAGYKCRNRRRGPACYSCPENQSLPLPFPQACPDHVSVSGRCL